MTALPNVDDPVVGEKPKTWKRILAWGGFLWGFLSILVGVVDGGSFAEAAGFILFGLAFFAPSAWWMYCTAKDEKAFRQYRETLQTNENLAQFLTDADRVVLQGMSGVQPPRKVNRHWPVVTIGSIVALVVGTVITPLEEDGDSGSSSTPPTTVSSSVSPAASTSAVFVTTSADEGAAEREREAAEAEASRAEEARLAEEREAAERARVAEEQRLEQERIERERAEQEVVPQQFVAPAQAPQQPSAYYRNCRAVWDAIGGPIHAGQPGYDSHLDRDGDGVGCEKDPR
ncbi:excalibur calcium-binding domain-containing protein [Corynebacterium riegelii]|uniref:excalibur calcium-binding domain-containing protein n=1 Tax=Corynebacterium riegelii TaxID=156976 RepID=UPI0006906966|nr:excalibur calcium-binding domain-containing protein [Corynebacterium riegelii]